jgi:2'-5' RNA ligase
MSQLNSHQFEDVYQELGINLDNLGCIMLDLKPLPNMYSIEYDGGAINLYSSPKPERFWINGWVADKTPHITLLYGLLDSGRNYAKYVERVLNGWRLADVEIDHVSYFDSPYPDEPYYCIVAHIKVTPELLEGHQRLEFLPHINTFAGYKPHMTVAYIRKDQGEGYRDSLIQHLNNAWAGKRMEVLPYPNLGGNK